MKKLLKIPCFPAWVAAVVLGLLALIPTYAYVRLIPAALAVIVAVYALLALLRSRKKKLARVLTWVFTSVLVLGVLVLGTTGVLILHAAASQPDTPCDYIVVLGAKVNDAGPSATLQERISCAGNYLMENPDTIAVLSGGKGADEPVTEAQCMYDVLVAMGIEPERLWLETAATSTWENLKFSLDIIEEKTGKRPDTLGVVSSEFHLFRMQMYAGDRGVETVGVPARTEDPVRWLHYFIREIAGVWHYIILGGQYD